MDCSLAKSLNFSYPPSPHVPYNPLRSSLTSWSSKHTPTLLLCSFTYSVADRLCSRCRNFWLFVRNGPVWFWSVAFLSIALSSLVRSFCISEGTFYRPGLRDLGFLGYRNTNHNSCFNLEFSFTKQSYIYLARNHSTLIWLWEDKSV